MPNTLPEVVNGTCDIGSSPPYVASLKCHPGYEPAGPVRSRMRLEHGVEVWNPSKLECIQAMPKTRPEVIEGHCQLEKRSNVYIANLTCNAGYRARGHESSELHLDENGTESWNPPQLECIPMTLNSLPKVQNGTIRRAQRGTTNGDLTEVDHTYILEDQARPVCYEGYEFKGPASIVVPNANNTQLIWAPAVLKCTPRTVKEGPELENGVLHQKSPFSFGTRVSIKCDPGYRNIPYKESSTLAVDSEGELVWEPATLSCEAIPIWTLPTIVNGDYTFPRPQPPYYYGEKATVRCHPKYESDVPFAEVVLRGGALSWEPQQLHCQPMTLKETPHITNGTVTLKQPGRSPYPEGTQVLIRCDDEYGSDIAESTIVFDPHSGKLKWDNDPISCQRINCPEPTRPPDVGSRVGGRQLGDTIQYRCPAGSEVIGLWNKTLVPLPNPEFKCNPLGEWQPELPDSFVCEPFHCPPLEPPLYGYVNYSRVEEAIAKYQCLDGTVVERKCLHDKTWSGQAPKCSPITTTKPYRNVEWIIPIVLIVCVIIFIVTLRKRIFRRRF